MFDSATTRIELTRTVRQEQVPFPDSRYTVLCVDGRAIGAFTGDARGSAAHRTWVDELVGKGQGAIHWPGGVYGLVLIPLLEVLQAQGQQLTADQVAQLTHGVHQVFTDWGMPFIWHDDEHTQATSQGARETHEIGCAAVKAAMDGKIAGLRGGDREAAREAYVAASEHPEGVRATYAGEHRERAFLVNLSPTHTIASSPDRRGNQWFLLDLEAGMSLLRQLAPAFAAMVRGQVSIDLADEQLTRELTQDAVRFGVGASAYLAHTLRVPIYTLPEHLDVLGVRRLRDVEGLYARAGIAAATE